MQFLVLGYDGKDEGAQGRRMKVRDQHLEGAKGMKERGELLYAVAMLNDEGQMCGSVMVTEFESREGVDQWLKREPYVQGNVWERVEVMPCKVPPMF